jgi:hypothetical protein
MPNHKLSKNVCLEKIRSVVRQITVSNTNLTVLIHMLTVMITYICFDSQLTITFTNPTFKRLNPNGRGSQDPEYKKYDLLGHDIA